MRSTPDRPQCCAMSVALVDHGEIVPRRGTTRTRCIDPVCPGSPASSSRPSTISSNLACALLNAPWATCNGNATACPAPLASPPCSAMKYQWRVSAMTALGAVSYTHLRAHETRHDLVCRLLLEKKKKKT